MKIPNINKNHTDSYC